MTLSGATTPGQRGPESDGNEGVFCISQSSPSVCLVISVKPIGLDRTPLQWCRRVFAVPADHRIKLKECEKRDMYLDLARELKKLRNMKVTIVPIVIGAFGTVT